MNSPHLEEDLSAYLAGELSSAEKERAERHLAECPECSQKLEQLRGLNHFLAQAEPLQPSNRFLHRVMARVEEDRRLIAFRSRRTIAWLALAASIAFLVFVLGLENNVQPPPGVARWNPKKVETPQGTPSKTAGSAQTERMSAEEAELIANLDVLENMDLIQDYDSVENLEVALLGNEEKEE